MAFISLRNLATGTLHEFDVGEVRLGRDPSCQLVVLGEGANVVSGYHARFLHQNGKWSVEDAGSRNGTSVNDKHVSHGQPQPVSVGMIVGLGDRGPKFKVEAVEKRSIVNTVIEPQRAVRPSAPTMPLEALNDSTLPVPGLGPSKPPAKAPAAKASAAKASAPGSGGKTEPTPAVAAPKGPVKNVIHMVVHDIRSGAKYEATGGRIRFGRGEECELRPVVPGDTSVSRVHAEVLLMPGGKAMLRDAKSRNGTFVNGRVIVGDHPLRPGEKITLGEGGPDLLVDVLELPGATRASSEVSTARTAPDGGPGAEGAVEKAARAIRRSFAGKGKTVFFREIVEESQRKSTSRLRWVVWSFVFVLGGLVGAFYWYTDQRDRATTAALAEQRNALLAQQAVDDSIRRVATADYARLQQQLDSARLSSAPGAFLDSLRNALSSASRRTEALEGALKRAETQMAQQVATGDSTRRAAVAEMGRLRTELSKAGTSSQSTGLLDSLRAAMREAERKTQAVDAQMRGLKGVNLPALAQSAGGAVGLVTAYIQGEVYDGSGFAITKSGYFVTNRHVAEPEGKKADSIFVTMADQKFMVRADPASVAPMDGPDVAIIRIRDYKGPVVPKVDWSAAHARQGEPAALIGFPAGAALALDAAGKVQTSMSAGIFSKVTPERIQFDGFTVGGSSGSPVFNADGEVVALHRSGLKEAAGLGFAVPMAEIVPYLPIEVRTELGIK